MGNLRKFILVNNDVRKNAAQYILHGAQDGQTVFIRDTCRSLDQNAKFHSMCHTLQNSQIQWAGKPRSLEQWKVLLVSGHAMATKTEVEVVQGLEGEFVNLREATSKMSRSRSSSLIEYTKAFMDHNNIFV